MIEFVKLIFCSIFKVLACFRPFRPTALMGWTDPFTNYRHDGRPIGRHPWRCGGSERRPTAIGSLGNKSGCYAGKDGENASEMGVLGRGKPQKLDLTKRLRQRFLVLDHCRSRLGTTLRGCDRRFPR